MDVSRTCRAVGEDIPFFTSRRTCANSRLSAYTASSEKEEGIATCE